MRIAYLAAGAGGMYCGSCLHDNTLAAELLRMGEDVILVPIYTPLRTDEADVSQPRVFFGGINAFLQQRVPLFRRTPRWLDGWLDSPWLLRLASSRGVSVDPAKLGAMTASMLRGEEGHQRKELDKLVDWLVDEVRPDVVHLSNAMMLGLARQISARGGPPIVCSLSGEDIFLDKLRPPYEAEAQNLMRDRATDVEAFVALNRYYADAMAEYLDVPRERIHVIPHGLELLGHSDHQPAPNAGFQRIGYLARICPDKGLHLLVEACEALARRSDVPPFELHVAGYLAPGDRRYLRGLTRRAEGGPLRGRFTHHGELTREGKIKFLRSLDIFATPTVYRESKGLPILEAWANGAPAVLPDHGAFPELAAATGGAVLHRPLDANDLAQKLADMLRNPEAAAEMGRRAQHVVRSQFNARRMAEETLALYDRLTSPGSSAQRRRPTADAIIQG